jgi:hypothetical protein
MAALGTLCACSSGGNPPESGAGALTCDKPSCCVPLVIRPDRVYLYRSDDSLRIGMVLDLGARPSNWWDVSVQVVLASGTSVSCELSPSPPAPEYKTVTVICPASVMDALPACDSTLTLELRPRSSTYPDNSGAPPLCTGIEGRSLKLNLPVVCPNSCTSPSNGTACSIIGQRCSYSALAMGGNGGTTTVLLPCTCAWSEILDRLAWSCVVA